MKGVVIPEGWTLEPYSPSSADIFVLHTPPPPCYMATIDFKYRGFRSGMCMSGRWHGQKVTKKGLERPKYVGRGWQQRLVDAAVEHLREVLV